MRTLLQYMEPVHIYTYFGYICYFGYNCYFYSIRISLVNESIVTYFLSDLQIEDHFKALRRYLCMADGDFAEILCDLIMEKVQFCFIFMLVCTETILSFQPDRSRQTVETQIRLPLEEQSL